jgi:hypothetical protein
MAKSVTREQAERKRQQAVTLMERIGETDRADDFDDMSVDEYAEHRGADIGVAESVRNGPRSFSRWPPTVDHRPRKGTNPARIGHSSMSDFHKPAGHHWRSFRKIDLAHRRLEDAVLRLCLARVASHGKCGGIPGLPRWPRQPGLTRPIPAVFLFRGKGDPDALVEALHDPNKSSTSAPSLCVSALVCLKGTRSGKEHYPRSREAR